LKLTAIIWLSIVEYYTFVCRHSRLSVQVHCRQYILTLAAADYVNSFCTSYLCFKCIFRSISVPNKVFAFQNSKFIFFSPFLVYLQYGFLLQYFVTLYICDIFSVIFEPFGTYNTI